MNEDAKGDKRKTRRNEWQEAKLCQVYKPGSIDKRHQANRVFGEQGSFLVDYYHRSEYFADATEECAGSKKEARVEWRHTRQDRMKSGDIDAVLTELDQHKNGKKGKAANKSEACHRYIRNRPGQFDYAAAKAANLPIGSGEIESSNSAIVQMRLKIPGAWWTPSNAGAMLCLRTLRANGDWNQYWEYSG